jgi:hypothetical protein
MVLKQRSVRGLLAAISVVLGCGSPDTGQTLQGRESVPPALTSYVEFLAAEVHDPVDYVLGLFDDYDVVILCERWHPEMSQYEFFLKIVSDPRFGQHVEHLFTELGARNLQEELDALMASPGLDESEVDARLVPIFRDLGLHGLWDATNFFEFLRAVYFLNQESLDSRIRVHFSDLELSWEGLTAEDYAAFREGTVPDRDRLMADRILQVLADLSSGERPAKALVIMNYRHAFNDFTFADGSKGDNAGRYLFEALPGRVANVMLNSVALLPGTTDSDVVFEPVQQGKWDAAFRLAGVTEAGFDFAGSPFGRDNFDYFTFRPHSKNYQDVFTGFLFYRPLAQHYLLSGIPGMFEGGFEDEYRHRLRLMGRELPEETLQEMVEASRTPQRETYDDPAALEAAISDWFEASPEAASTLPSDG